MILILLSVGPQPLLWGAVMDSHIPTVPQQSTATPALPCQVLPSQALPSLAHACHMDQMLLCLRLQSWFDTPNKPGAAFSGIPKAAAGSLKAKPQEQWSLTYIPPGPTGHVSSGCCPSQSRARKGKWGTGQCHQPSHTNTHLTQRGGTDLRKIAGICSSWAFCCILPGCNLIHTVQHLQIGNGTSTQIIKATQLYVCSSALVIFHSLIFAPLLHLAEHQMCINGGIFPLEESLYMLKEINVFSPHLQHYSLQDYLTNTSIEEMQTDLQGIVKKRSCQILKTLFWFVRQMNLESYLF